MTLRQRKHSLRIRSKAYLKLEAKFAQGAKAHIGETELEDFKLSRLLDESINEALDLLIYLLTLQEKYDTKSRGKKR